MRLGQLALLATVAVSLSYPALASSKKHHASAHAATVHKTGHAKPQSQRSIDDARATEIQAALIKAGYLTGTPSGHWDAASEAAMQKVQADNGWQTKLVPDSRALIKLGLGPNAPSDSSLNQPAATTSASIASTSSAANP